MEFKDKLMSTMMDIVAVPGISGTASENATADKIYEILQTIPYFNNNPDNLQKIKIKDDALGRTFVSALYCSKVKSSKTIILTGHHDVVGVEAYGHLKALAFEPYELTRRITELKLPAEALEDLNSGEWLFGRGVADMKHGIALGIELLRELSQKDDFAGNILFLSVPSEEYNSEGMLGAVEHLVELQNSGLDFSGLLLLEPSSFGTPEEAKTVFIGAAGKVNTLFFFAGKETHVSEPFSGLNVNLLVSEFNRLFELNVEMCEEFEGELSVPPTCLKQTDLKELYDVTTPLYAAAYYNVEILGTGTEALMLKLKRFALQAFENVIEAYNIKCKTYVKTQNRNIKPIELEPAVYFYSELYDEIKSSCGNEFDRHLDSKINEWEKAGYDLQTIAVRIVKEIYDWYPNKVPMIIIGFAPPFYPSRYPYFERQDNKAFYSKVDSMIEYAQEKYDVKIVKNKFYGVSDFSYIELGDMEGIDAIGSNLLGLNKTYMFPAASLKQLSIPGIVLGCWGKDPHKYTERLNVPYSFEVAPVLCRNLIYNLLKGDKLYNTSS